MEQTPVKDVVEEKPVDIPKDAPPDSGPDPTPGPPDLGLGNGPGSGGLAQGKGRGGGGGGGNSRFGWYASIVQSQMEAALQANEKTRYASMQAVIRVWLDGTGKVSRVQLSPSTGDGALDATIRDQVIGGMRMREPPPRDMPMPIITRITARSRAG
jgi:outer membrane biosynthesis protein TonB